MPREHGSLELLKDPVAEELLAAAIPARLAYLWTDDTPRVVPIWFHWTGEELVLVSPAGAPKLKALKENPNVAVTIDTEQWPAKCVNIRGVATLQDVQGEIEEQGPIWEKYVGDQAADFRQTYLQTFPASTRISIKPEWVDILDIPGGRFPSAWG